MGTSPPSHMKVGSMVRPIPHVREGAIFSKYLITFLYCIFGFFIKFNEYSKSVGLKNIFKNFFMRKEKSN